MSSTVRALSSVLSSGFNSVTGWVYGPQKKPIENPSEEYQFLTTRLTAFSDQDPKELYAKMIELFPLLRQDELEECITEFLGKFLERTPHMFREQLQLALVTSSAMLKFGNIKEAIYFAATAMNIAEEHERPTEEAERLIGDAFLSFLQSVYEKNGWTERPETHGLSTEERIACFQGCMQVAENIWSFATREIHGEFVQEIYKTLHNIKQKQPRLAQKAIAEEIGSQLVNGAETPHSHPTLGKAKTYRESFRAYQRGFAVDHPHEKQEEQTEAFTPFMQMLVRNAESVLGAPPCPYELCAMGSFGRGEPTPLSDLEPFLFIAESNEVFAPIEQSDVPSSWDYFEALLEMIQLQILSLGESRPQGMPWFTAQSGNVGLQWDVSGEIIATPEQIADSLTSDTLAPRSQSQSLFYLRSLYGAETGLSAQFVTLRDAHWNDEERDQAMEALIRKQIREFFKQREHLPNGPTGNESLSLKESYFQHFHILQDIALRLQMSEARTLDIIDALYDRDHLDEESHRLLKEAYIFLYDLRCKRGDELVCGEALLAEGLSREEIETLRRIDTLFLDSLFKEVAVRNDDHWKEPSPINLYKAAFTTYLDNSPVPEGVDFFVAAFEANGTSKEQLRDYYLQISKRNVDEGVRRRYVAALSDPELKKELLPIPNIRGDRLIIEEKRERFAYNLRRWFLQEGPGVGQEGYAVQMTTPLWETQYYIRPTIIDALFDGGDIRTMCTDTNGRVGFYDNGRVSFHFKQAPVRESKESPFHPGRDWAMGELVLRLFGRGAAIGEVAWLSIQKKGEAPRGYFVYISETVRGPTLKNADTTKVDPKQLSEIFLAQPLLSPGDLRAANAIVEEGTRHVVLFDQDVSLVPAVTKGWIGKECQFYSELFFIFPNHQIDREVIEAFMEIQPGAFLLGWTKRVIRHNSEINKITERDETIGLGSDMLPLFSCFRFGQGTELFAQFNYLQQLLRQSSEPIPVFELLRSIQTVQNEKPIRVGEDVYRWYDAARKLSNDPRIQIKRATGRPSQSISQSASKQVMYDAMTKTMDKPYEALPQRMLYEISNLYLMRFSAIAFSQEKGGLASLSGGFAEVEDPERIFPALIVHQYAHLNLSQCQQLTPELLRAFLEGSGDTLTYLDLRHCPQIDNACILEIAVRCPHLKHLYISHCPKITLFAKDLGRGRTTRLVFPNLRHLHAGDCPDLTKISLEAPHLERLKINDNPNLAICNLKISLDTEIDSRRSKRTETLLFGEVKWSRWFKRLVKAPTRPEGITEIMGDPCPFWTKSTLSETHSLILIPETDESNSVANMLDDRRILQGPRWVLITNRPLMPKLLSEPYSPEDVLRSHGEAAAGYTLATPYELTLFEKMRKAGALRVSPEIEIKRDAAYAVKRSWEGTNFIPPEEYGVGHALPLPEIDEEPM